MIISAEKPAILERLEKAFGPNLWGQGVIITYGDTVYCEKGGISLDLQVHEQTHIEQQAEMGVELWWDRYLADPKFRLDQELVAYRRQAEYIRKNVGNRKKQAEKLEWIWRSLSSPMYGGIITYEEAQNLI